MNSNPEILLKKRRNADSARIQKQQQTKERQLLKKKTGRLNKNKFIRIEQLVSNTLATNREKERVKRIGKLEQKKISNDVQHLQSQKDFILKVSAKIGNDTNDDDIEIDDDEDEELNLEKIVYDGKDKLIFALRIRGPKNVKLPNRVHRVLNVLRLTEVDSGVFLKLTTKNFQLLKIVSPYILIGTPSLASIRSIIQKRSKIIDPTTSTSIILNDNNLIEEKLGESGIICLEDIIHEIATLGESFKECNFFLQPFKLNREVSGFSAINQLKKLQKDENTKKFLKHQSNSAIAPLIQIDMDALFKKIN